MKYTDNKAEKLKWVNEYIEQERLKRGTDWEKAIAHLRITYHIWLQHHPKFISLWFNIDKQLAENVSQHSKELIFTIMENIASLERKHPPINNQFTANHLVHWNKTWPTEWEVDLDSGAGSYCRGITYFNPQMLQEICYHLGVVGHTEALDREQEIIIDCLLKLRKINKESTVGGYDVC